MEDLEARKILRANSVDFCMDDRPAPVIVETLIKSGHLAIEGYMMEPSPPECAIIDENHE